MNRTKLKNYAPQARRDFIQAMTDRAAFYGLTPAKTEPVVERGDVAVIAGREHPRAVATKRKLLEDRIRHHGFGPTMEALAYTWFNRLVAVRYMELHGYLDHGYRVLSHPEGKPTPEIVEQAEHVELPGLKKDAVIDLKLAGNKEGALYRLLLTAQCNALHTAMPFLFERIDDETELLLPDNLLHSDSLIRKLVGEIDEEDWKEVEIIGWLYQFYISDKKDEVIGKVVASEDIPAATQLFTPNWIVKYLVQNTLGRQWLATYPQSALRQQMAYYIEPAEQTPEVQAQLKAITPTNLNPEELTLLDPACGSGHILVEGYDLFKAIYTERGYNKREIPRLILEKNLFGLEIDDRAAQLAAFALMMKARADDRRIFDSGAKPNVVAFVDSQGMSAADITDSLNSPLHKDDVPSKYLFEEVEEEKAGLFGKKALAEEGHVSQSDIASLLELFENAKTFGSLIQAPPDLAAKLPEIANRLDDVLKHGDLTHATAHLIKPLLQQAQLLARHYAAVVANPPYMGGKYMNSLLKQIANRDFPESKADLFAVFAERLVQLVRENGRLGLMTPFVWMFIASYEALRQTLSQKNRITCLVLPEYHAFFESAYVPICAFVVQRSQVDFKAVFIDLSQFYGESEQAVRTLEAIANDTCRWRYTVSGSTFTIIPGNPLAFTISDNLRNCFRAGATLASIGSPKKGMATGDNQRFIRKWFEVSLGKASLYERKRQGAKWFPYNTGGEYRKWYGNIIDVLDWENDGREIRTLTGDNGRLRSRPQNIEHSFAKMISWTSISSTFLGVRYYPDRFLNDQNGNFIVLGESDIPFVLGFLCSTVASKLINILNPTMHILVSNIRDLPLLQDAALRVKVTNLTNAAIKIAQDDWDDAETSWDFKTFPLLIDDCPTVSDSCRTWEVKCDSRLSRMKDIEAENNRLFIEGYGLQSDLTAEITDDQITLCRPDRTEDIRRLVCYAIGCVMGRYSLDKPGLIYAHSGNQDFDPDQYKTFRADDDGIIPLLETDWGIRDDATSRFVEFIGVAWPKEHLEENLKFVADSLGTNAGEQPRDTIRRYLATGFYKHHLSMYKKRPIYWLFSSGKLRTFQCLVYLHRYNEGTLARMRTEYVIPLQGQIASRIEQLEGDKAKATSTSHRKKLQKEQDDLKKQQAELLTFEEKLKHAADQKIALDLDDGVKVNYGKFGDLLAEAKAICGSKEED